MVGGGKLTTITNSILGKLIENALATKYSWQRRKGKKAFGALQISKLIISILSIITIQNFFIFIDLEIYMQGY